MNVNLDELEPGTKEFEAAVDALDNEGLDPVASDEDDKQQGGGEQTQEASTDEQPPKADGEPAAKTEPEPKPDDKPAEKAVGVASKDGKRVLPYAALQGAREQAKTEREKREAAEAKALALEQQLADLKAGKPGDAELTDEQLEQIEALGDDVPAAKQLVQAFRRANAENAELRKSVQPKAAAAAAEDPKAEIQRAIDEVPMLLEWQHSDPEKWAAAIEADKLLQRSPKWKGKPLSERFDEAVRRVAREYDIDYPGDEPDPKATKQGSSPDTKQAQPSKRTDPDEATRNASRAHPNTLSDFKGGAAPDPAANDLERMPAAKALGRLEQMDDAEFERYLARLG